MAPLKKKSLLGKGSSGPEAHLIEPGAYGKKSATVARGLAAAKIMAAKAAAAKTVVAKGLLSPKKLG